VSKIIAIDYGLKRVGIAISDENSIIASPLTSVNVSDIFICLKEIFNKEDIISIVVGDPKGLDGKDTDCTKETRLFINKLSRLYPKIKIHTFDERFTSKIALRSMNQLNIKQKKRKKKELINEISACIILQDFLNKK
tara:strand:- start:409 stop:819 length:411 start_codon:yes stop_codon:yes gene_type:complete